MCAESFEYPHDRGETVVVPCNPLTGCPEWIAHAPLLPYCALETLAHHATLPPIPRDSDDAPVVDDPRKNALAWFLRAGSPINQRR